MTILNLLSSSLGQKGNEVNTELARLNKYSEYFETTDPLLAEQLWKCPIKQLPMYAEKSLISINHKNRDIYQSIIVNRMAECEKDSQIKRLEKVSKLIDNLVN
jgi:hypothetical protein